MSTVNDKDWLLHTSLSKNLTVFFATRTDLPGPRRPELDRTLSVEPSRGDGITTVAGWGEGEGRGDGTRVAQPYERTEICMRREFDYPPDKQELPFGVCVQSLTKKTKYRFNFRSREGHDFLNVDFVFHNPHPHSPDTHTHTFCRLSWNLALVSRSQRYNTMSGAALGARLCY